MNRRTFLASLGALLLAPVAVFRRPKRRPYDFSPPIVGRHYDLVIWDDPVYSTHTEPIIRGQVIAYHHRFVVERRDFRSTVMIEEGSVRS